MATRLLVAAASSLTDVLPELAAAFRATSPGIEIRVTTGSTGAMTAQIRAGAPIDILLAAGTVETDALAKAGKIAEKPVAFAGNSLVCIAPKGTELRSVADLSRARRIVIGNPLSVPAGRFAEAALRKRGLWNTLSARWILAENVRQALSLVASGDCDAGFVFATDARRESRVRVVETLRSGIDHPRIEYVAARVKSGGNASGGNASGGNASGAARFVAFLRATESGRILRRAGFLAGFLVR